MSPNAPLWLSKSLPDWHQYNSLFISKIILHTNGLKTALCQRCQLTFGNAKFGILNEFCNI